MDLELHGEKYSATKPKLQYENCSRYICLDAYPDISMPAYVAPTKTKLIIWLFSDLKKASGDLMSLIKKKVAILIMQAD
ncbi:MAG: hypothetical protein ACFE9L_05275 [Candidatus Hodarchaeota archaeon]